MPRERMEIEYKNEGGSFKVMMISRVEGFFQDSRQQPDIKGKEGGALVAALLACAKGAISEVRRHKDGKLDNVPNGEAAVQEFNDIGMCVSESLYEDGLRNDGANGQPAYRRVNDDGISVHVAHYKDDRRNDSASGEAAEQISGNDGRFVYVARYKDDEQVKVLTAQEMAEYQVRQLAVKNAGKAPPDGKKPGPAGGGVG